LASFCKNAFCRFNYRVNCTLTAEEAFRPDGIAGGAPVGLGATPFSLDCTFVAKDLVERVAIRDYVLRDRDFLNVKASRRCESLEINYSESYYSRCESAGTVFRT